MRQQLGPFRRVDAVEAAMPGRRAGDAHMHFLGARFAHHLHDLERSRAADDGIIDQDDALALYQGALGVMLQLPPQMAALVARPDAGDADLVREADAEVEGKLT